MKEVDLIRGLRQHLRASPDQRQAAFEADAEIVDMSGQTMAITIDEFSAEDGWPVGDPDLLGWNLVTATLSDLLAVGAQPRYMLNAFVAGAEMDAAFLAALSGGLREALDAFGAFMLGGDTGTGNSWRFTGVGLGGYEHGLRPCSRLTALDQGVVMATGTFGDGNRAAGKVGPLPRFECRLPDARRLDPWLMHGEVACMDTSDGLGHALETLAGLNSRLRFLIDLDRVRLAEGVAKAADHLGIRPETFLLASAGEYELLALVPDAAVRALETTTAFRSIGSFELNAESGLYYRLEGERATPRVVAHLPLPDPRDSSSVDDYRGRIIQHVEVLFGPIESDPHDQSH